LLDYKQNVIDELKKFSKWKWVNSRWLKAKYPYVSPRGGGADLAIDQINYYRDGISSRYSKPSRHANDYVTYWETNFKDPYHFLKQRITAP
jgi:molybdopterin/thiamine biosynthesis adenylyltransferase